MTISTNVPITGVLPDAVFSRTINRAHLRYATVYLGYYEIGVLPDAVCGIIAPFHLFCAINFAEKTVP